jgi:DnaJ-class molecular chaperone
MFGGGGGGFEDILGGFGGGAKKRGKSRRPAPAEPIAVEASVPFMIAATGGTISLDTGTNVIEVKVPAGIEDGKKLRVSGQGPGGGDIVVQIKIEPHAYFRREGKNILLDVPISVGEAILGGKVEVPTIDGKRVEVKIRPGTSSGSKSRLPGLGIAGADQFLVFKIVVPKGEPDAKTKSLIEDYQRHQTTSPRADVPWK